MLDARPYETNPLFPTPSMLRAARLLLGLTQDKAGELAGVSQRSWVSAEVGKGSRSLYNAIYGSMTLQGVGFERNHLKGIEAISYRPGKPLAASSARAEVIFENAPIPALLRAARALAGLNQDQVAMASACPRGPSPRLRPIGAPYRR